MDNKTKEDLINEQKRKDEDAKMAAMTLPQSGTCEVTDTEARMSESYFRQLLEYSSSLPTGKFVGKRWKRKTKFGWWLMEYTEDPEPGWVGIKARTIVRVYPD